PGNSWFLRGTTGLTAFPGDAAPSPPPGSAPPDYGVPPDPGTGPQVAGAACGSRRQPCASPQPTATPSPGAGNPSPAPPILPLPTPPHRH
ncbi:MAG TPA: hypothetical protein VFD01_00785, partial [Candidatus Dormibacteraeota bacterium]|nr:hypothetical protein [Candidatus Dormibacteraeota bacterium]